MGDQGDAGNVGNLKGAEPPPAVEEPLRASSGAFARQLLESIPDPVIGCDSAGEIVIWSGAARDAYGYSTEEAVGVRAAVLLRTRLPQPLLEIIEEVADLGHWEGTLVHRDKGGREVTVESRWVACHDELGRVIGRFAIERELPATPSSGTGRPATWRELPATPFSGAASPDLMPRRHLWGSLEAWPTTSTTRLR